MAKNRVFGRPIPDASVPRNGFDLSKRINMQLPFGAIIPCYAHQALAGSQFRIGVESFFRTGAVNTAAFPRLKMETEFFCVPIRYLWSFWDNFKLGINDLNSTSLLDSQSNQSANQPQAVPTFDTFSDLWSEIATSTATDPLAFPWSEGAKRLADMLGYGRYNTKLYNDQQSAFSSLTQAQNFLKIAAYQKIYYDHFRNTAYESNNPWNYNLDACSTVEQTAPTDLIQRLFTLRYVDYRKDYFTSVFPGLNFIYSTSGYNAVFGSGAIPSWVRGLSYGVNGQHEGISPDQANGGSTYDITAVATNGRTYFSVQGIRAMFALDKLLRSAAYAPQHVKQQYEARYGIKFPASSSFESQRIGSFDTDIAIGEVTSTANTENSGVGDALGAIGGKGIGGRKNTNMIKFDVKEDSIIIGVCYAIPRQMYDSHRFENFNMKMYRNDFFIPEYMNLGLKPVYLKEMCYGYYNQSYHFLGGHLNVPIGYQLPYMEYKADVDENHGLFADVTQDLSQFTVHTNEGFQTYVSGTAGVDYRFFKVKPGDLDSIFVVAADGTESTDHLFGELTFHIPVNQNMSVHGVPSL